MHTRTDARIHTRNRNEEEEERQKRNTVHVYRNESRALNERQPKKYRILSETSSDLHSHTHLSKRKRVN